MMLNRVKSKIEEAIKFHSKLYKKSVYNYSPEQITNCKLALKVIYHSKQTLYKQVKLWSKRKLERYIIYQLWSGYIFLLPISNLISAKWFERHLSGFCK